MNARAVPDAGAAKRHAAGIAHSQVFFSDEDFYRHIEKKQQMAVAVAEMLERAQQRQEAKELALKRRVNAQKALDYYWLLAPVGAVVAGRSTLSQSDRFPAIFRTARRRIFRFPV
jgi:hypothetical protein